MRAKWIIGVLVATGIMFLSLCREVDRTSEESKYVSLQDSVGYVGMETCRSCHANIFETYHQTGMGQSFDAATREKSAAQFGPHALVYDSLSNFYYKPFWRNDTLMVREYRLDGPDTIHSRAESIAWIIGSGQHTNSHMVNFNGYVYQAPITFYTQDGRWDMAPGFEGGYNSRFSRLINMECLTCHNGLPTPVPGSVNKYAAMPHGIDCERCHGPGAEHVKTKLAGETVDTSRYIDYTIVNPADLSTELQMNLCQRCHLQGVATLNPGSDWSDFKPGMHLREVMQVFMPKYKGAEDQFIMASHVERLKESECFQAGELSCITCHNPHLSVRVTGINHFNDACQNCHSGSQELECALPMAERLDEDNDCSGCHMPKSGSIDIPHVAITDHNIRIPDQGEEVETQTTEFLGLRCMTDPNPSALMMARGYLRLYEGFGGRPAYLDSAWYYLQKDQQGSSTQRLPSLVHYHYAKQQYRDIRELAGGVTPKEIDDGNTAFRIGEAFMEISDWTQSLAFFERAVKLQPLNLEFLNRLGSTEIYAGELSKARRTFELLVSENDKFTPGVSNLGILLINLGETEEGERLLWRAIKLDPDYSLAYFNLAEYYNKRFKKEEAREVLELLLRHQPRNGEALEAIREMR